MSPRWGTVEKTDEEWWVIKKKWIRDIRGYADGSIEKKILKSDVFMWGTKKILYE